MQHATIPAVLALVLFIVAGVMFAFERAIPHALVAGGLAALTWATLLS